MKNNYVVEGDIVKVYFRKVKGCFIIDLDDFEKVSRHTWYLNQTGYPSSNINGKHCTLHRLLMGENPKGMLVDHINRNKLDNKRCNLRFCTPHENNLNRSNIYRPLDVNSMVGIRCRNGKRGKTYRVEIHDEQNNTIYLGSYKSLEEAKSKRDSAFLMREQGLLSSFI